MVLDGDAVVWALRAIGGTGAGMSATEIAGFLAKDATLSEKYTASDVRRVLEELAAEGVVTCQTSESEDEGHRGVDAQYRLVAPSTMRSDGFLAYGFDEEFDAERDALRVERDALVTERDMLVEVCGGFARERDALVAERERLSQDLESAQSLASQMQTERDELLSRADRLERVLARERAAAADRSVSTQRVVAALRKARQQLEARDLEAGRSPSEPKPRPRRFRGNWLTP